jgi:hypothetical protein
MTLREFYLQRRQAELPAFLRVLQAIPADQLGYKPEERSPSAEQLVWTLTGELKACLDVVNEGRVEWESVPAPPLAEMIGMFERWSAELVDRVSRMDEAGWGGRLSFSSTGRWWSSSLWENSCGSFTLMRSTIGGSSRRTCGRWAGKCRRFMARRRMSRWCK